MACVLLPFRREKARADEFLITASISLLHVELRKKKWHPHKLAVFWKKRKAKYSTKPVAWFAGIENANRGVHFWPEPDSVDSKLTLLKNPEDEMTEYQEKQWNIFICNVSRNGRHQLLATGCIDISNYVTEKPGKVDVTVTLQPAIKKVVSGKIEFELSWVIQEEDPVIHPTDEEIWEEIMQEAREEQARRKAEGKTEKYQSLKKARNRKHGHSSATDIAAEEDRKKTEKNDASCSSSTDIAADEDKKETEKGDVSCSSSTGIAAEEDRKKTEKKYASSSSSTGIAAKEDENTNEQQGGVFQSDKPWVNPSPSSDTKAGSGKVRKEASLDHVPPSPVPPQPHPRTSQGLQPDSEEKNGGQSKKKLHKTVRFQIDGQPKVLHPIKDDEEAPDSFSVLFPETVYNETGVIEEDEGGSTVEYFPKRDDNSSSSVYQVHTDLASYVEEELNLVQDELLSSEEVRSKVELEMQAAVLSERREEMESLKQGWLILDDFHSKVMRRKEDLLALGQGENIDNCLNLLRSDLRCLSEVEEWKKTDTNRAQEKRVATLIAAIRQQSLHA